MTAMKFRIPPYRPVRCNGCGRRLGDFQFVPGCGYRIRCPKCGKMNADKVNLNHTSVLVFMSLLNHCNSGTPETAIMLMREYLEAVV